MVVVALGINGGPILAKLEAGCQPRVYQRTMRAATGLLDEIALAASRAHMGGGDNIGHTNI